MKDASPLLAEWQRLELLTACVHAARRHVPFPEAQKTHLQQVQEQVASLRQVEPWADMTRTFHLNTMDQDILACAIAPNAEPMLGGLFQELQPATSSPYPSLGLIRELLFLDSKEVPQLRMRLGKKAPLLQAGLVESEGEEVFKPVRPTSRANHLLLGWSPMSTNAPPGTVEIPVTASWDLLTLPEECVRSLREFRLWITHRGLVEEQWGARLRGGPVALFYGPSGTGKTLAAEVLAGDVGWPLYRVDLGMLVSKYVGETEKNLNRLFDAAHGQSMVLLFDEADGLFGKRGETKEARDRYANMEVNHLLARMEYHKGPCILTSNLRRHLDPAFARRFQMVVEFTRPDLSARAELWRRHLPPRAPYDDVDVRILAEALDMTGGQIRNIAHHAAFIAAGENRPISLRHMARAARAELVKTGGEVLVSSLGSLARHLGPESEERCP